MANPSARTIVAVLVAVGAFGLWMTRGSRSSPSPPTAFEPGPSASRPGAFDPMRSENTGSGSLRSGRGAKPGSMDEVLNRGPGLARGSWRREHRGPSAAELERRAHEDEQETEARFMALQSTALHAADPAERIKALGDLDDFEVERIEPILVKATTDSEPQVRLKAVESLAWNLGEDAPFAPLANAAADSDPEVRVEALEALDDIEDPRARAVINGAVRDSDEDVRFWAEVHADADDADDSDADDADD
jgi:hypothetical protein